MELEKTLGKTETVYVLIPAFNESKHITNTLSNLVLSSYSDLQIWILDDASSDGFDYQSLETLDKRVKVFRNSSNLGKADSLNAALRNIVPENAFAYIIDADAIVEKDTIKKLRDILKEKDYGVVGGRINTFEKSVLSRLVSYEFGNMFGPIHALFSSLRLPHPIHGTNFMLKNSDCRFDPAYATEDFEFFARNLKRMRFGYANDAVIFEYAPAGVESYIRQRQRWLSGFFKVFCTYWDQWLLWFVLFTISIPCISLFVILALLAIRPDAALLLLISAMLSNLVFYRRLDTPFLFLMLGAVYLIACPIILIKSMLSDKSDWKRTEREN